MTKYNIVTDVFGTAAEYSFTSTMGMQFRQKGADFYSRVPKKMKETIDGVMQEHGYATLGEAISYIADQIKARNFKPEYMAIIGAVNTEGFNDRELVLPVFVDVPPAMDAWKKEGRTIGVYSNGSVPSQRAQFAHTTRGNLTNFINSYFDTAEDGSKKDRDSYKKICDAMGLEPSGVVYLSDDPIELDAADQAGLHVRGVVREGNPITEFQNKSSINSFSDLDI